MGTNRTTSTKKFFFRFDHFYFFANLFMGYINSIVMKNFSFHSTRVFISKEEHTKNFANTKICDFLQFLLANLQKKFIIFERVSNVK